MTTNSNKPDLLANPHQFGETFRYFREQRGYSLKEAAGGIISVSHLSQFEQGKRGVSLEKFSELLLSIGIDWSEFGLYYPGFKVTSFTTYIYDLDKDKIRQLYQKFPQYEEELEFYMAGVNYGQQLSPSEPAPLSKTLVNQLLNQSFLSPLEVSVLMDSLHLNHLTKEETIKFADKYLENLKQLTSQPNMNFTDILGSLFTITKIIYSLSRNKEFQKTYKMIEETKKAICKLPSVLNPFIKHDINLDCYVVYTLLREGRTTEAFSKKVKLNQLLDAIIAYNFSPSETEYFTSIKSNFNLMYRQLSRNEID